jgi:uncharacterized protein YijF (DUF1287 family)
MGRAEHNRRGRVPVPLVAAIVAVVAFAVVVVALIQLGPLANAFTALDDGNADHASEFGIDQVTLGHDEDGDGIDDQLDMLVGARAYVAGHPRYKSAYYEGGYPDDGYGVCTDVVAAAYLASGYDLRELVDADIREAPDAYGIDEPDPDIDYRRVRNLRVCLERNATSLTCDPTDVEAWQGGDIVVFENHIGIVSDKRNERGVTYVIHHNDPWQAAYEQDILESRDDIVGHYRLDPERAGQSAA